MGRCRDSPLAAALSAVGLAAAAAVGAGAQGEGLAVNFSDYDCVHVPREEQVHDWHHVFQSLVEFLETRDESGRSEILMAGGLRLHFLPKVATLKEIMLKTFEGSREREIARLQCPIGLLCLCVVEATALASMHTEDLEPRFRCIHELLAEVPVYALAGSKWPVFRLMEFLWGLNKIPFRQVSDFRNMNRFVQRQYADFAIRPEELAPFGAGQSVPWSSWLHTDASGSRLSNPRIEELMAASQAAYNTFSPNIRGLVNAIWNSVERDGIHPAGGGRPIIRVSVVFGTQWAEVMPLAWARWATLGFRAGLFVTMDDASKRVCGQFHLTCVPAGMPSVLHKYSITTLALHLGVDVLYCDLDAVPLGNDPLGSVLAALDLGHAAGGRADIAVSTHNYDCLNAGLWFVQASNATAGFFLALLEYLYEHWYEGDQRAFNAFATGNVSVSYEGGSRPRFPALEVAVLSPDVFAGTEGLADVEDVQVFHTYKMYGEEKLALVRTLYGAYDLPSAATESRAKLWEWARDTAAQARVGERARALLGQFQKPRASSKCW